MNKAKNINEGIATWAPDTTTAKISFNGSDIVRVDQYPYISTLDLKLSDNEIEALWDKMYTKVKKVIVSCGHCKSNNAISNSTCIQCGAPLGG